MPRTVSDGPDRADGKLDRHDTVVCNSRCHGLRSNSNEPSDRARAGCAGASGARRDSSSSQDSTRTNAPALRRRFNWVPDSEQNILQTILRNRIAKYPVNHIVTLDFALGCGRRTPSKAWYRPALTTEEIVGLGTRGDVWAPYEERLPATMRPCDRAHCGHSAIKSNIHQMIG
jgi:hypothetical protein